MKHRHMNPGGKNNHSHKPTEQFSPIPDTLPLTLEAFHTEATDLKTHWIVPPSFFHDAPWTKPIDTIFLVALPNEHAQAPNVSSPEDSQTPLNCPITWHLYLHLPTGFAFHLHVGTQPSDGVRPSHQFGSINLSYIPFLVSSTTHLALIPNANKVIRIPVHTPSSLTTNQTHGRGHGHSVVRAGQLTAQKVVSWLWRWEEELFGFSEGYVNKRCRREMFWIRKLSERLCDDGFLKDEEWWREVEEVFGDKFEDINKTEILEEKVEERTKGIIKEKTDENIVEKLEGQEKVDEASETVEWVDDVVPDVPVEIQIILPTSDAVLL